MIDHDNFYQAALAIAQRKLATGTSPKFRLPRLGTGGNFSDIFLWDTAFSIMWAKYHPELFPVENSLDNFYLAQDDDGFISRQYLPSGESKWSKRHPISFAPPLLAWAELEVHRTGLYPERLRRVYDPLRRHHEFCCNHYRRDDGLFFSDPYGCGMDNLPRWPGTTPDPEGGLRLEPEHINASREFADWLCQDVRFSWNQQCGWIDTSAQMAFNAHNLAEIATLLGKHDDARAWRQQHDEIAANINRLCWSEEEGFYFDVTAEKQIRRFHCGAWWMLLAEAVPQERLDRFLTHLCDPAKFGRPIPVPSLAADEPEFQANGGYWLGPVWAPVVYMVLKGLQANNRTGLARELAQRYYNGIYRLFEQTGTIWENVSPEQGETPPGQSQPDFCGWSALGPITIYREFIAR